MEIGTARLSDRPPRAPPALLGRPSRAPRRSEIKDFVDLVGGDLAHRIDAHLAERHLFGLHRGGAIDHQIDDALLGAAGHDEAAEVAVHRLRRRHRAHGRRGVGERVRRLGEVEAGRREEVEVLGVAVAEVEAAERPAAGQEHPALAREEPGEQIALQRREAASTRGYSTARTASGASSSTGATGTGVGVRSPSNPVESAPRRPAM